MPTNNQDELVRRLKNKIYELENENKQLKKKQVEISVAKEMYLKIFQDFPALIWRARTDKLCDYFNTTWLDFTGRSMEQEYGNGWAEGVHAKDLDNCFEIYTKAFDKREVFYMEYRLKNYSGEYRWIEDHGHPYYDFDGTFLGYIGVCFDITKGRRNEQRLEELSVTDALTKTFNRLKLDAVIENEVMRAERYQNSFSVIMLDIDNFKYVNDTYGHQSGDVVLIKIAKTLLNNVRKTDTLGRWGGEEFMIICPEIGLPDTIALAEKFRRAIEGCKFPEMISITASFGVATYQAGDNSIDISKRADAGLYRAKANGKNRVEKAPE